MNRQKDWFQNVSGDRSMRSIAAAIGVASGNLSNWLNKGTLPAERVIEISYELGVDPVQALRATGFLKPSTAPTPTVEELEERIDKLEEALSRNVVDINTRRNSPESVHMFDRMVADTSPDEDVLRGQDDGNMP